MKNFVEKNKMIFYVFLNLVLTIGMNLGHPVTPSLMKNLNLPPHVFGLSFAAMCLTNFVFALVWSNIANGMKKTRILLISSLGYAVAQIMFGFAQGQMMIYGARLLSGIFAGGFQVGLMSYVVNEAKPEEQAHYITINSILVSVGAALGFFLGGILGDVSITFTFVIQAFIMVVTGTLFYLLLGRYETVDEHIDRSIIKNSNPLSIIKSSKDIMKGMVLILLVVTLTSSIATTLFDQSFNYYIKDIFNFMPSQNGMIKAVTGLFAVVLNGVLIARKKKRLTGSDLNLLKVVFFGMGVLAVVVSLSITEAPFVGFSLAWFALYTMMIPILQNSVIAHKTSVEDGNRLAGLYNSFLMVGKILGALITSLVYTLNPLMTFFLTGVVLLVSWLILVVVKEKR